MHTKPTFALMLVFAAIQAHGFGGSIAIGLGQANQINAIEVPFTASATIETEEHKITEQIYYTPGKLRDEIDMGGQKMTVIRRYDLKKTWTLMPQKMFMESMLDDPSDQVEDYRLVGHEVIGRETVNGEETTKHKVIYETDKGRYGGFTWFTDDNIAVKAFLISEEAGEKQRIQFEMTSIHRAPQPDALFEVPAGYSELDLGAMGVSGAISGMTGTNPTAPAMPGAMPGMPTTMPGTQTTGSITAEQQACLDAAVAAKKKKKRFSAIAAAGSRLFGRFGGAKAANEIYQTQATVDDAATIANELGLSETDVQGCLDPTKATK